VKGLVFNLFEDYIRDNLGDEKLEEILDGCALKTAEPFVGPGSYPDEDLLAIIDKTVAVMGTTHSQILHAYGRYCVPKLAQKYPAFFNQHRHPKTFLKTVNSIHSVEVKKLYADAEPPQFIIEDVSPDRLAMQYRSRRGLCHLVEGMIEGLAEHYDSPIRHVQHKCMLEGEQHCEFELIFVPEGKSPS